MAFVVDKLINPMNMQRRHRHVTHAHINHINPLCMGANFDLLPTNETYAPIKQS